MRHLGRAASQPVRKATPSVASKEEMAAIIKREYPFMSDDCIRDVLDKM